jgi:hypothetical protein
MSERGQQPNLFTNLYIQHEAGTDTYAWGMGPYADAGDYFLGWKEPRLLEVGTIERRAYHGSFQGTSTPIRLNDNDNLLRTLVVDYGKADISGQEFALYHISRSARLAEQDPTVLARGVLRDPGMGSGKAGVVLLEDWVGSNFGPFGPDKTLTQEVVGEFNFSDAPEGLKNVQVVPRMYGPWSDEGAVTTQGRDATRGLIPAYYVGDTVIGPGGINPSGVTTLLDPPPAPTFTKVGAGGSTTWTYAFVARTATGRTTLGGMTTITGLPADGSFASGGGSTTPPTNGVTLEVAQYSAPIQAQVTGLDLYVKLGDASSKNRWHFMDAAGQAFTTGYHDNGDDGHFKTWNSPPKVNTATLTNDDGERRFRVFLVAAGYVRIDQLFGSNLEGETGERALLDPDTDGFIIPESAAWFQPNPWVVMTGRRYTLFYGEGEIADAAVEGRISLAVNACGYTEDNTDATDMIDGAFVQIARAINDFLLANDGDGYDDGSWPAPVTFPGSGIQMIDWQSFYDCQDWSKTKLGNAVGYLGHIYLNEPITLRDFLNLCSLTFDCYFYVNKHGQLACGLVDETQSFVGVQKLRDHIEIMAWVDTIRDEASHENQIFYVFDYDPDQRKYRRPVLEVKSQDSRDFYRRWVKAPAAYELRFTRDQATAAAAMAHRLLRHQYVPIIYRIKVFNAPGLNLDIGVPLEGTSYEGTGPEGLDQHPLQLMGVLTVPPRNNADSGHVIFECLDMERIAA